MSFCGRLLLLQCPANPLGKNGHFLCSLNVTLRFGNEDAAFVGGQRGGMVAGFGQGLAEGFPGG